MSPKMMRVNNQPKNKMKAKTRVRERVRIDKVLYEELIKAKENHALLKDYNELKAKAISGIAEQKQKRNLFVSVDVVEIGKKNGVEDLSQVSLDEIRRLTFILNHLFHELDAHGK